MARAQGKCLCDLALPHEWSGMIEIRDRARNAPYAMQSTRREAARAKSSFQKGSRLRGQRDHLFQRRHRQLGVAPHSPGSSLQAGKAHPFGHLSRRLPGGTAHEVLDIRT